MDADFDHKPLLHMDADLAPRQQVHVEDEVELTPHKSVAVRAYITLSIAGLLSVSAIAMLLGTIAAKGFAGLMVHVITWTTTFQVGLTGVFIDFYLTEKRNRWVANADGVRVLRPGSEELFVSWDSVSWISPREHRIAMAVRDTTNPETIYFVDPKARDSLYNMYLVYKVYPMTATEDDEETGKGRVEPRGVIAYDPDAEEWDRQKGT